MIAEVDAYPVKHAPSPCCNGFLKFIGVLYCVSSLGLVRDFPVHMAV